MVFPTEKKNDGGVSAISKWWPPANLQIRADSKGDFSGDIGKNSLFSGHNKLVQIISRLFFLKLDIIDKISAANVKKVTDTEVTNWKLGGYGTMR